MTVGVFAERPALSEHAFALATALGLPPITDPAASDCSYWLCLTPERLELRARGPDAPGPVYVDFAQGRAAHRRRFGGGRNQPLARAVGLKKDRGISVVDASAGLGRDAFVLACLGCTVWMVERSPILAALLRDGMRRAASDPEIGPVVRDRLRLIAADSRDFLADLPVFQRPEVVYLDPMYPHRRKSALVKKDMRVLRELVGDDEDAADLLATALRCATRRAVVKRPRLAPALSGPAPGFHIISPNTRFDIYLTDRA